MPINITDTQNYICASESAIIKAGWSSVAEGLISHTNIILLEREDVLEDTHIINNLKQNKLIISLKLESNIDYEKIKAECKTNIDMSNLINIKNDITNLLNVLIEEADLNEV